MPKKIKTHRDLDVYQLSFDAAMKIFEVTKRFPKEETYSPIRFAARRAQCVPTSQKRGADDATRARSKIV